ncbi:MAG: DNA repair protein RecO [Ignavibacteria bacterium]|nr:DNA repair protein RecO [Ignavibacteria bacterium]
MSIVETEAILIKKFKFGDTSIIANFFSKNFGKFSALIKGARNLKSGKSALYQSLNRLSLYFNKKENRELQIINKADLIDSYEGIKKELDKINTGLRILELTNKLYIEYDKHAETYHLLVNILKNIEISADNIINYLIYFQLKISEHTGISFFGNKKEGKMIINSVISDETFDYKSSFKEIDTYMDVLYKINLSDLDSLNQLHIDNADLISDFLDSYLIQDNYGRDLKTKRTINQMKSFN